MCNLSFKYSSGDLPHGTAHRVNHVIRYARELGLPEGSRVLDLGCGDGVTSTRLLEFSYRVEDRSELRTGCAETLDMEDSSFDLVIAEGFLEYLTWDRFALQEMKRVLRSGGHLIVSVPNKNRISYIADPMQIVRYAINALKKPVKFIVIGILHVKIKNRKKKNYSSMQNKLHQRLHVPSELKAKLTGIGFEIRDEVCYGYGPFRGLGRFKSLSQRLDSWLEKRSGRSRFLKYRGNNYVVLVKKPPELKTLKEHSVFKGIEKGSIPDRSEKKYISALERWIKANKEYSFNKTEVFSNDFFFNKIILVLSPHPDDELIGCGGTLLKALEQGASLTILQLTDGSGTVALADAEEHTKKNIRLEEARVVALALGDANLVTWKETGRMNPSDILVERMSDLINHIHPNIIFVPFIKEAHPDHVATSRILARALKNMQKGEKFEILSYEVWGKVPPKNAVIIDDYLYEKERLLMKYITGMKVEDYVGRCLRRSALNSIKYLNNKGFAEVFLVQNAGEYVLMVENN